MGERKVKIKDTHCVGAVDLASCLSRQTQGNSVMGLHRDMKQERLLSHFSFCGLALEFVVYSDVPPVT